MQFHLIFVRIEVVYGVFCSFKRLDLWHFELCRKGEMQHLGGEWRLGLLHQGVHGDWNSAFYLYLHVADFLLDVPEPLLPRPLLVAILSGGLVRIMLHGVASFPFSICFSTRVEVLLFSGNRCDASNPEGPLTTRQPAEYLWMSGNPTLLMKIGQSLLCTTSSTQGTKPVPTIYNDHTGSTCE